jgi:hypothetical protein
MKIFIFDILKVTGILVRIYIRIWISWSEVRIRGSGYVQKCHGSATVFKKVQEGIRHSIHHIYGKILIVLVYAARCVVVNGPACRPLPGGGGEADTLLGGRMPP